MWQNKCVTEIYFIHCIHILLYNSGMMWVIIWSSWISGPGAYPIRHCIQGEIAGWMPIHPRAHTFTHWGRFKPSDMLASHCRGKTKPPWRARVKAWIFLSSLWSLDLSCTLTLAMISACQKINKFPQQNNCQSLWKLECCFNIYQHDVYCPV